MTPAPASATPAAPVEALILGIGCERFAVTAASVRNILDPVPVTRVPGARDFVPALINVRGAVMPLVDLRMRFGMAPADATADTRFVVLWCSVGGDWLNLAVLADKVFEVAPLNPTPLAETTKMGLRLPPELIRAVARWRDDIVLVPDLARVLD